MFPKVNLPDAVLPSLRCPKCHSQLARDAAEFACMSPQCNRRFPIVDDIPVLLNEDASVFKIDDFVSKRHELFAERKTGLRGVVRRFLTPSISSNLKAEQNCSKLAELLLAQSESPQVLVVGGGILGQGMNVLAENPRIQLTETDVSFGTRTMAICDAHDIPFADGTFDAVVIQAVLEHVVDPYRCVDEIHRVLKDRGIVYAETPFMQQVHGGAYDFTRFTHLGHRRLFRKFEEIDSGAVCGPGMSLAWTYRHFLLSFTKPGKIRALLEMFAHLTSFYLKYFDRYLIEKPSAFDGSSGYYFIGRKTEHILPDKGLIDLYKGTI